MIEKGAYSDDKEDGEDANDGKYGPLKPRLAIFDTKARFREAAEDVGLARELLAHDAPESWAHRGKCEEEREEGAEEEICCVVVEE